MDNWFTVEKIDSHTFAISEYKHWEKAHSYLVIGEKKAALIDTGLGVSNIKNVVSNLTDLSVIVITTHAHWDHIGGHKYFDKIYVHEKDAKCLTDGFPIPLSMVKANLLREPCDFPEEFDAKNHNIFQCRNVYKLNDNDIIDLGKRKLKAIHTPGHSEGHICLYEEETGYLFSGDLIYKGTLDAFYPSTNPFDFMNSVKKVEKLNVKRILPAHYSLDVPISIIKEISAAFSEIYRKGDLVQGKGIFKYKNFNIHI